MFFFITISHFSSYDSMILMVLVVLMVTKGTFARLFFILSLNGYKDISSVLFKRTFFLKI